MKRTPRPSAGVVREMRSEYRFDYRQARPNRFAATFGKDMVAVVLEPDVASVFNTSEAVNALLRSVIAALPERTRSSRAKPRKKAG